MRRSRLRRGGELSTPGEAVSGAGCAGEAYAGEGSAGSSSTGSRGRAAPARGGEQAVLDRLAPRAEGGKQRVASSDAGIEGLSAVSRTARSRSRRR
ncbi:hypothetical protein E2562_038791 [Oryza meyeriana var. granulata]|uniref:Uncharacterized protein n=1 Tax=Oryza meyeriana var. granulata TaxID=110450 RepID=A0A6G1C301_9ORYZ|nr:hypothetical protein E2562_038791 [Oryza meyeriana var. granulata]